MSQSEKRILFIYQNLWSFVKTDLEILTSKHLVTTYQFKPVKGLFRTASEMIKLFTFLLFNIRKFDSVFVWFADYHSFLPVLFAKIFGKKSFVVIGGYDVAKMPMLRYGVFVSKLRGFCAIYSMKNSTLNLAVSKNVERKVKWIAKNSNTQLFYNCVNIAENKNINAVKENLVITVGLIDSERTFYLKGIDTFIEVAWLLPEFKFAIIGMSKNLSGLILKSQPKNLKFIKKVNHDELEPYYKKAKIYCQFSRSESFGVAIVEAMNFGCVPIVTNVGGMPELVGKNGRIVKRIPGTISSQISDVILNYSGLTDEKDTQNWPFSLQQRRQNLDIVLNQYLKN
jgi:glycosyltransferase involved in cell wall biosynthesis